jgi:hypothetical protein
MSKTRHLTGGFSLLALVLYFNAIIVAPASAALLATQMLPTLNRYGIRVLAPSANRSRWSGSEIRPISSSTTLTSSHRDTLSACIESGTQTGP